MQIGWIAFFVLLVVGLGLGFGVDWKKILSSQKSSPKCPYNQDKNNESYFTEKMSKIEEKKQVELFTAMVVSKLYKDSENYDKSLNVYGSLAEEMNIDKSVLREEMKASYNIIIEQYGYPKCILTQTQLSACKEVLDDLLKTLN